MKLKLLKKKKEHGSWLIGLKTKIIDVKLIYKVKYNVDGSVQRNKARLVAKGYSQQLRVDFHETFAPVACLDTLRALISLAAQKR